MIVSMSRVRLLGPRDELQPALRAIQDLGLVHLAPSPGTGLPAQQLTAAQERERRYLRDLLDDLERTLAELAPAERPDRLGPPGAFSRSDLARWARRARRLRREVEELRDRGAALAEERALLLKYRGFFATFQHLLASSAAWPNATAFSAILRLPEKGSLAPLRQALAAVIGEAFELRTEPLPAGDTAMLLLVPATAAARVEKILAAAQVQEIPVPAGYGATSLAGAVPRMLERLAEIPRESAAIDRRRGELAREQGGDLRRAQRSAHDRLSEIEALPLSQVTGHAFVLEGWLPAEARPRLEKRMREACGETVVVSEVAREDWQGEQAPVVLSNPRLFRPFEALVKVLPLPSYGTIDPTPFVAVFFPMFFGLILGDVGYGGLLAILALALHRRARPGSPLRSATEIAGPCAAFAILFGFAYGEFFGDLGRRWLGLKPLLFDREEGVLSFLGLAVAVGLAHVFLGLVLGVITALRHDRKKAAGHGVAAFMLLLVVAALLAAAGVLPKSFFTPVVVALLAALPVLVVLEGVLAPLELLATLGNVLSYARVMALGTASVMLAVVANRMVGAMGSAVVGVLFALLFHLVNFALGLFSPVIHAMRLHYVEFFGKFYSPGGVAYRPFGHWSSGPHE